MQFLHFDKSNDFPFNTVDNVMQDSYGYLWIGSSTGLARYDGYTFEVYTTQDKKNGLPSNRIFCTFETSKGDVLVGTNLGLAVYDRRNNKFKLISYSCTPDICEDKYDQVWVATFDGIDVRDAKSLQIKTSFFCEADNNVKVFNGLTLDAHGRIWTVTASSGIYVFDTRANKLQKHVDSKVISNIEQQKAYCLAFDNNGVLWMGTRGNGLICADTVAFKSKTYVSSTTDLSSVGSNNIASVYVDTRNDVWVCCQYGYLNRLNRRDNSFERFMPRADNARFLNANSISCINQDKTGNYWVGTYGNGMYCLSAMYNNFQTFISPPDFSNRAPVGQITSFAELDNGIIAMACDGGGVKFYNPADNSIREFVNNKQLRSRNVHNIIRQKNLLWGATWGGGIFRIDLETKKVTNFIYNVNNPRGINFNNIMGLYAGDTALVVGTQGEGLACYVYKKNSFVHKNNSKAALFSPEINGWVNHITRDSRGNLWISTFYGLFKLYDDKLTHYGTTQFDNSINSFEVLSVFEDSRRQLWVLTTQGLDLFDYETGSFERMSEAHSLPTSTRSLVEDDNGDLWLCSSDKLVRIAGPANSTHVYDKNDGIISGEFKANASFKASDGTLYFGSTDGFMRCIPSKIMTDSARPQLCFRNLFVNYVKQTPDSVYLKQTIETSDTLEYEYTEDVISIELAAILLGRLNKIDYSYSFDGDKSTWLNLGKDRVISFTALKPGSHTLTVKASVEYGPSAQRKLIIIVNPRWWMTWWFKAVITLLMTAFIAWFIYLRINKIRDKNIQLKKLVKERTVELERANNALTQQSETLSRQAQSLQQQNKSLEENKLVIEMKSSQLEESLVMKDKLIGIIAHDFKNPLSGIYGLSSLLKSNMKSLSAQDMIVYIDGIMASTTKLKDQMMTVLDWAQGQMQDMAAKPVEINIETIIDDTIVLVKESSVQKNITIVSQLDYATNAFVDPRMMSTVMRNLLVNAIKFTSRGGSITVVVQEYDTGIEVNVIDSGVGMSKEMVDNLFVKGASVSSYGTEDEKGTGLGLQICKSFVDKNGGSIIVRSTEGEGSVFTVTIPKGKSLAARNTASEQVPGEELAPREPQQGSDIEVDKTQNVLVIDDDLVIVTMLRSLLEPYYTIFTATDGKSGLQLARNMVPNLIISDIKMPHVSGVELCKIMKEDAMTSHIPIILITSMKESDVQRASYASGADNFVEKPLNETLFMYKVKSLINNRKKLLSRAQKADVSSAFIMPESYDDAVMKRTLGFINQNFCNSELDMNVVAENVGLSRTQLWRKFKSTTGSNPSDYILNLRLSKAAEMLQTGKFKVSEIAYEVGFSSPSYFAKCFSDHFGVSPKDYEDKSKAR